MKKIVLLLVLLSAVLIAQEAVLDSLLNAIKSDRNLVGMSVTVVKDSQIVFSKGYGLRQVSGSKLMTDSTVYRIASISKMVTATAIMKLFEEGHFDLSDDISDHLGFTLRNPSYPDQVITISKVLSHTSSLRDGSGYGSFLGASYNFSSNPPKLSQLLISNGSYYSSDMLSSSKGPDSKYFQYANINYGVLGTLVEKVSGKRFDVYCRENIFEPLGLNASFNIQDIQDIGNVAVLYRKSGNSWSPQFDNHNGSYPAPLNLNNYTPGENGVIFAPQGGLRISGRDLGKLMLMYMNNGSINGVQVLADTTVQRMIETIWSFTGTNGNNYYGIFNNYGCGCSETTELLPGETLYGHPGEAYGLISDMYFSKEGQYGIVFLTNGGSWGYGNYSGWYNVEEDVFKAVFAELPNLRITNLKAVDQNVTGFELHQNYPNPFNPATKIKYSITEPGDATLTVYDVLGKVVFESGVLYYNAGTFELEFRPEAMASGIYYYNLTQGKRSITKKMVLLK